MTAHVLVLPQLRGAAAVRPSLSTAVLAVLFVVVLVTFGGCVGLWPYSRNQTGPPSGGTPRAEGAGRSPGRESPNIDLERHASEGGLDACIGISPPDEGGGVYYRFTGRIFDASLQIDEQYICPNAENEMVTAVSTEAAAGSNGSCGSSDVGIAELPERLPAELGAWLALVDLYSTLDAGRREPQLGDSISGASTAQSQNKIIDDDNHGHMSSSTARHVCQFEPGPGITCAFQLKTFLTTSFGPEQHLQAEGIPGAKAEPEWQQQERWGLRWRVGGTFYWDQVSRRAEGRVIYEMRLSLETDIDARDGSGRVVGQTVVCRSDSPVFFNILEDFEVRAQKLPNDKRRICVGRKDH